MNIWKALALTGAALGSLAAVSANAQGRSAERELGPIANQYICVFDSNIIRGGQAASAASRAASQNSGQVLRTYENSIRGFVLRASAQGMQGMLRANPFIKYCEQDRVVVFAPPAGRGPGNGGGGGGEAQPSQTTPWGIERVNGGGDGSGKRAWVIDSGIDLDHPDLNVNVALSQDFTGSRKGAEDENGHGTHVAGTIAALDNGYGVIGVAAGAEVVAVRVLDRRGSGAYSEVIAGVDYVAANGSAGDVANMSLGGPTSSALDEAVLAASAQVKFTLAAGNSGTDAGGSSPARVNAPNIFTISAIDPNGNLTSWSNYGSVVDYAEPGLGIESTWKDGGYNTISGTSMAAPHAAGILLLGNISTNGFAGNDRDGNPDPIGVH